MKKETASSGACSERLQPVLFEIRQSEEGFSFRHLSYQHIHNNPGRDRRPSLTGEAP
jgi:hypothetical protein